MTDHELIDFSVTYQRDEYLALVREHILATAAPEKRAKLDSGFSRAFLALVGGVMFTYKSFRIGTCHFVITPATITRRAKSGEMVIPWTDVTAFYQYGVGFIIAKKTGAVPIPYRVLSQQQVDLLAAWAGQRSNALDAT